MTISSTIRRRTVSPPTGRRIGYSAWGFLTSGVPDTPDGARAYRRGVIDALRAAGNDIVLLQADRDLREAGIDLGDQYRFAADLPELDAVVFEWRWPLPGRNTIACGAPGHTCDLHRQQELIEYYTIALATPTVIWDMDRRLPADDPLRARANVRVGEYALHPTPGAFTLPCPVPDPLLDHADPYRLAEAERPMPLVYVGNQYGRDDAFDQFFAPAAALVTHRVAGKWTDTGPWPHVNFAGRCRFDEVADIHREALATVLLLPERYRAVGHQTSRLFEAVTQGCLPLTPADTVAADRFTPPELHVRDATEVVEKVRWLQSIVGTPAHRDLIRACLRMLEPYRLSTHIAVLLDTLHTLGASVARRPR